MGLPNNFLNYSSRTSIREFLGLAAVVEGELFVVEAELVEEGGLVIVGGDLVHGGAMADFIGLAINGAALETAAGQPGAEALAVVVTAWFTAGLHDRQTADFAAPMDNGAVEQAALF